MVKSAAILVFLFGLALGIVDVPDASAQDLTVAPTGDSIPAAQSEDVQTIDGIILALYDVISGGAGVERDWNRFLSLFDPEARLIPTFFNDRRATGQALVWSPAVYIERAGANIAANGFFEREIGRSSHRFENIAQVFSTYESRRTEDGPLIAKGINSIQLMWDGERWWIMNVFWRGVGPEDEIPSEYLRND
ncbi:MAG: hypothetical protein OEZ54_10140 [Gemmatimonadota bacterium]|nr:hypothetical protein [Gemmatimonadota bacterium]